MQEILWLLAGHFIGDFAFQTDWMAVQKGKSWEVNAYHALVYTAAMFVVTAIGGIELTPLALLILAGSHFLIDPLKARWGIIHSIWADQLAHFILIFLVVLFLL